MMDLREGMKVDVTSPFISGPGVILHISPTSYCPVQVELDQPDGDGHRVYRFHYAEVHEATGQQPRKDRHTVELIKRIPGYPMKAGECFTAGPTRRNSESHYLIYNGEKCIGCYPKTAFRILTMADVMTRTKKPKQADLKEAREQVAAIAEERPKAATPQIESKKKPERKDEVIQTSIFDFI